MANVNKTNNTKENQKQSTVATLFGLPVKQGVSVGKSETIQASIPIKTVHDKANLIESYDGCFTRSYEISNINYQTSSEPEQDILLTKWRAFLKGNKNLGLAYRCKR